MADDDAISTANLSLKELMYAALLMVAVSLCSYVLGLGIEWSNGLAGLRCALQIIMLAYFILEPLFATNTWKYILPYLAVVVLLAARESMNRLTYTYDGIRGHYVLGILVGVSTVMTYTIILVLMLQPWWDAQYMIPTAGMIMGNQVTATALVAEAFLKDLAEGSDRIDLRLCRGASMAEAAMPTVRMALNTALTPSFNMMTVMGLVSMPGMMTGQILAGQSPLQAGLYQVMIMYLLMAASFIACVIILFMASITVFDPFEHYLRRDRIIHLGKKGPRRDIITALVLGAVETIQWLYDGAVYTKQKCASNCYTPQLCPDTYSRLAPADVPLSGRATVATPLFSPPAAPGGSASSPVSSSYGSKATSPKTQLMMDDIEEPIAKARNFVCVADDPTGVERRHRGKHVVFQAVDVVVARTGLSVNLAAAKGEVLVITGVTGAGKSTTMKVLARTDRRLGGELYLNDVPASSVPAPTWRTKVVYVSQDRPTLVGSPKDLYDMLRGFRAQQKRLRRENLEYPDSAPVDIAADWGLDPAKFYQPWSTLSGGESQRASLAIGLALKPEVLLLDEPTSALDQVTTLKVEKHILATGAAVVLVTHSVEQAQRLASARCKILDADDSTASPKTLS